MVACRIAEATDSRKPLWDLVDVDETGLRLTVRQRQTQCLAFRLNDQRSVTVSYKPRRGIAAGTMQPDVMIAIEEEARPAMIVALTANYRAPAEQEVRALHQYRDTMLMNNEARQNEIGFKRMFVRGASLYPHRERQPGEFEGSDTWSSLQRSGIGQLPLLPRGERYLDLWLESILRDGGWDLTEIAVPHTPAEAAFEWRRAESETALIGLLRLGEEERHLAWIRESRMYYTRATPQTKSRDAKWIAFYSPATDTMPIGAIRHWSEIESASEMPRSAIPTPWAPRHNPHEIQMVYRLKELRNGLNIQNARGERVSQNRWSTRLALLRARRLEHLALETEPEWTLYEHVTASRIDVTIEPQSRRAIGDRLDLRGRAKTSWAPMKSAPARQPLRPHVRRWSASRDRLVRSASTLLNITAPTRRTRGAIARSAHPPRGVIKPHLEVPSIRGRLFRFVDAAVLDVAVRFQRQDQCVFARLHAGEGGAAVQMDGRLSDLPRLGQGG